MVTCFQWWTMSSFRSNMPRPTPTPHDHSPTTPETNAVRKLRGPCGESTILIRITRNWKSKRGDQHTIGLRKAKDLQL